MSIEKNMSRVVIFLFIVILFLVSEGKDNVFRETTLLLFPYIGRGFSLFIASKKLHTYTCGNFSRITSKCVMSKSRMKVTGKCNSPL